MRLLRLVSVLYRIAQFFNSDPYFFHDFFGENSSIPFLARVVVRAPEALSINAGLPPGSATAFGLIAFLGIFGVYILPDLFRLLSNRNSNSDKKGD